MLGGCKVHATLAVSDLGRAKQFYGDTLGLNQAGENAGGVMYESGGGDLFVYVSNTAGKGEATCAFWDVPDIEAAVNDLRSKGVAFEHYPDMPGVTLEGDVHVMGNMKAAWFKDPDGNILSLAYSS